MVVVGRDADRDEVLSSLDGSESLGWLSAIEALDRHGVPDGLPFIVDDDGSLAGCDRLNTYMLTAWRQRAYDLDSLRDFHAYHLARLRRFIRARRGGECVDLTATTTEDLTAYRDARQDEVQDSTSVLRLFRPQRGMGSLVIHRPWRRSRRRTRSSRTPLTGRLTRSRHLSRPHESITLMTHPTPVVGAGDSALDQRLSDELDKYNAAATSDVAPAEELTVRLEEDGELLAGLSGWTWGQAAGIGMTWVHPEHRRSGLGSVLLAAFEDEAKGRGCTHVFVTSFTFQAPDFYQRHGYMETFRWESVPTAGRDDVHMRKDL